MEFHLVLIGVALVLAVFIKILEPLAAKAVEKKEAQATSIMKRPDFKADAHYVSSQNFCGIAID